MDSVTKTRQTRQTRQTPTNVGIVGPKNPTNPPTPYRGVGLSGGVSGELGETDLSGFRLGAGVPDFRPAQAKEGLAKRASPVATIVAEPAGCSGGQGGFSGGQIAALVVAGRLLQSRSWPGGKKKIECEPGETYPQAVARVVAGLADGERDHLRELVGWVRSYERAG